MTTLTEVQAQAARHYTGPAIVIAGPGSGKTRVLVSRIQYLIKEKGVPPDRILAVTFTEKATDQMQGRLFTAVGAGAGDVRVSTIHSLCRSIMEENFMFHGYGASFGVMDEETQRLFVNAHRRNLGIDGVKGWLPLIGKAAGYARDHEAQVCAFYNTLTEHGIDPAELEGGLTKLGLYFDDGRALLKSYGVYCELAREAKLVDFAHLQSIALGILKSRKEALEDVRRRFAFALVDEYQDTSPAQDELIRLVAGDGGNVFVVGDENQSIYGFRGADVENFRKFPERYPGAARYCLMKNFRSGRTIVEAANLIIEKKIKERLEADRGKGNEIILVTGENRSETARNAAAFIKRKIGEGRLTAGDAAFLYRKKCLAADVRAALEEAGLPFVSDASGGFTERPEVRDLLNVLSYVHQKSVSEAEFREWNEWWKPEIFDNEIVPLSRKTAGVLESLPRGRTIGGATTEEKAKTLGITDKNDARVIAGLNALKEEVEAGKTGLLDSLYGVFRVSGCLSRLIAKPSEAGEEKLFNLARLTSLVQKYESQFSRPSAKNLLWFLYNKTIEGDAEGAPVDASAAVKCMTVHKAKGLEFPAVVLCSTLEGDFPLRYRPSETVCGIPIPKSLMKTSGADEDSHYEEELRLFYVAVTRAQDLLVLCVPEKINVRKASPSRFVKLIEKYVTGRVDSDIKIEKSYEAPKTDAALSYSAAHTYHECPFLYRLVYYYNFAAPADENRKHGVIVHNLLQKVNWAIQHKQAVGETDLKRFIDESWVPIYGPKRDEKHKSNYLDHTLKYVKHARDNFSAIESFETPFTYIDGNMIIRGKTDLVARDKDGKRVLVDFKARTMEGIEETGVEDQLRVYHHGLKDPGIERLGTYTFFDGHFMDFDPDDKCAAKFLADVSAGLAAESFPRRKSDGVCEKCHFSFICKELPHG